MVFNMSLEDPGQVSFSGIGGLSEQIRELREVFHWEFKAKVAGNRVAVEESGIVRASWNQTT